MKTVVLALLLLTFASRSSACPFCNKPTDVKPTVTIEEKDAGGLYFGAPPPPDKTRHYYLAAEAVRWEWVPGGKNTMRDTPLPPPIAAAPATIKIHYVQYTDSTFTTRIPAAENLGLLGPTLRGVTGEYLAVTFLNLTPIPLSVHPHGVHYDKDSEGAYYQPNPGKGAAVATGARFTYVWYLDESSAPGPGEPSSKCWFYHSHCTDSEEVNAGLAGMIIVTDSARARPDGTPADVDREFVTVFQVFEEEDEELEERVEEGGPPPTFEEALEAREAGMRHGINGRLFGTLQGLDMVQGERVRWYLGALGDENGLHTAHWHGLRLMEEGRRRIDVVALLPGETKIADCVADNPGTWLYHCHIADHMMEGMFAPFVVHPRGKKLEASPFLGARADAPTIVWRDISGLVDPDTTGELPKMLTLRASVPVYRGFFVPKVETTVRIGERELPLKGRDDSYTELDAAGVRFTALNADKFGVVRDNMLEFELTFSGTEWRNAAGLADPSVRDHDIGFELRLGKASHRDILRIRTVKDGETFRIERR